MHKLNRYETWRIFNFLPNVNIHCVLFRLCLHLGAISWPTANHIFAGRYGRYAFAIGCLVVLVPSLNFIVSAFETLLAGEMLVGDETTARDQSC
jgi:hypothetical protein